MHRGLMSFELVAPSEGSLAELTLVRAHTLMHLGLVPSQPPETRKRRPTELTTVAVVHARAFLQPRPPGLASLNAPGRNTSTATQHDERAGWRAALAASGLAGERR